MVWSRPALTGHPPSATGHTMLRVDADDTVLTFSGMGQSGYQNRLHALLLGLGNARLYEGLGHGGVLDRGAGDDAALDG